MNDAHLEEQEHESVLTENDAFEYEVDKNDRSAFELNRWIERKKLDLSPEWQREFV